MIAAIFNCFTIPFKVAYKPPAMDSMFFTILNVFIDFTFFVDILVTFRTVFINDYGNEIFIPREIALEYVSGQLWLDLAATIPMDTILELIFKDDNLFY